LSCARSDMGFFHPKWRPEPNWNQGIIPTD
jgi:hypothetical protein